MLVGEGEDRLGLEQLVSLLTLWDGETERGDGNKLLLTDSD
jgi:hypothetical protein